MSGLIPMTALCLWPLPCPVLAHGCGLALHIGVSSVDWGLLESSTTSLSSASSVSSWTSLRAGLTAQGPASELTADPARMTAAAGELTARCRGLARSTGHFAIPHFPVLLSILQFCGLTPQVLATISQNKMLLKSELVIPKCLSVRAGPFWLCCDCWLMRYDCAKMKFPRAKVFVLQ